MNLVQLQIDYSFWGFILAIVGIAVTVILVVIVLKLDSNRRTREEEYYKTQTKSYIHDILTHFVEIDKVSQIDDFEEEDEQQENQSEEEIQSTILLRLNRYYKQNYKKMEMLLDNVQESLAHWRSLDKNKREKYMDIINDFKWLVNEYFSINKSEDIQLRMWNTQHKQVTEKRYKIDDALGVLIE